MSQDPDPRLLPFHHLQAPYKTFVDNNNTTQQIQTDILIPKTIPHPPKPKPLPIIIYFHGGGLVCGSSLYLDWFPSYLLELAQSTPAVLLAPNYRLLPEATIHEVFDDVLDFWAWVHSSPAVPALLANIPSPPNASGRLAIDRSRVLVAGGSAGGYLSLCLALRFPEQIRGAVVGYPAFLGLASSFVSAAAGGAAAPAEEEEEEEEAEAVSSLVARGDEERESGLSRLSNGEGVPHGATGSSVSTEEEEEMHHLLNKTLTLATQHRSPVRTFTDLPDRLDLMNAAMRTGRIAEMFARGVDPAHDPERSLRYPMERLDDSSISIPRGGIAILHGREDEVVPVEDSVRFVAKAKMVLRAEDAGKVVVTVREGGHGFDTPVGLGDGWLWESLGGVVGGWLE
ncbi:alpha/beta-hydrolase [Aspergillus uvarum CBS 121591]|uniref:Alpha/beta-hydrolase n=1 Tax=Aspergillus uvarum CBS 121591 TaxID=1448315 RepID=A0A319C3H4_9EURO|nr:alpha/beta-hydrolase [Aspergillus uvarum CBS 121591]PYH79674.1 alpha/beta-hydrolase [Aspergillus uvarum CBS 121591]